MKSSALRFCLAALVTWVILPGSPAMAQRGHDRDYHGRASHSSYDRRDNVNVVFNFSSRDRDVIRNYYVRDYGYRYHCPPGQMKKHRCRAPRYYRHYVHGEIIPGTVWRPLPNDLLVQLRPAPRGTRYVAVNGDVYLISERGEILDNVTFIVTR